MTDAQQQGQPGGALPQGQPVPPQGQPPQQGQPMPPQQGQPPQGYGFPPPQQGQPVPQQQGYGFPPPQQQGYGFPPPQQQQPVFPAQQGFGPPGPAQTPMARPDAQGGPGFPPAGVPHGRYGPGTFQSSDLDEPDWEALAQQNEAQSRSKKRVALIGGGLAAVLVVGGIVGASIYLTNGKARVDAQPTTGTSSSGQPNGGGGDASPSASASASGGGKGSVTPQKAEDAISQGSTDKADASVQTMFPDDKVTVQGRVYTRAAVDFSGACGDVTTNGLGPVLRDQICKGLYRATYLSDKQVITVGIAVFDDKVQAVKVDQGFKGNMQVLPADGAPKVCGGDATGCKSDHKTFGRYTYITISGNKDGSAVGDGDQATKDILGSVKATLLARGTKAAGG
ncbi:hypothetical protein ACFYST_26855 [Kitasatospora sp. NPDC004614]|uniref:hypothetical protein n=1 Tax=unclassified Kitasatospora TaxID=2633591 RepID=UPI0036B22491